MTQHPGSFKAEREITTDEAVPAWRPSPDLKVEPAAEAPVKPDATPLAAPSAQPASAAASPVRKTNRLRSVLLAGAAALGLAGVAYYGWDDWTVGRFEVSTDDAYVEADTITIAPKVSGYLGEVLVGDNEAVKAGQVLARIDPRDYRVALEQAEADVAAAKAAIASKEAAIVTQRSAVDAARATITVDHANQTFAEQENKRYGDLATSGFGTVQNAQQAASRIAVARASVDRDQASLASATNQVELDKAELEQARAALAHAEAVRDQARLNLGYTSIVSPVDGTVGNRTLRVGQFVQAGTQLMSVVPSDSAYVVANYKETQLTDVRKGQAVGIEVDMYPGRVYHGVVDSIAPASGQTFALLPPDNATGNFTKVVQRIPVKITLDRAGALGGDLRPGMSVTPVIETKAGDAGRTGPALPRSDVR